MRLWTSILKCLFLPWFLWLFFSRFSSAFSSQSVTIPGFSFFSASLLNGSFPVGSAGKESACNAMDLLQYRSCKRCGFDSWVGKIPLEKEMATHSRILAWKSPWTEKSSRLQSIELRSWTWLNTHAISLANIPAYCFRCFHHVPAVFVPPQNKQSSLYLWEYILYSQVSISYPNCSWDSAAYIQFPDKYIHPDIPQTSHTQHIQSEIHDL